MTVSQEYDEDEEDDDGGRYKRRRRERHGGFILDEAEVDDEVESEDGWEDGADGSIISNDLDERGPTARDIERLRRGTNLWEYVLLGTSSTTINECSSNLEL